MSKGLRSLNIGGFPVQDKTVSHILNIPLEDLRPNPFQPRKDIDTPASAEAIKDLANSIQQYGQQQPITVQKDPDDVSDSTKYIIVAGERRWRAMKLLKRQKIEARLVAGDPETLSLIENIQRSDLHPIDEARAYKKLMDKHKFSQQQLADIINKKRTTVNEYLRINNIEPNLALEIYSFSEVSKSLLIQIGKASSKEEQVKLWKNFLQGQNLSKIKETRTQKSGAYTPAQSSVRSLETVCNKLIKIKEFDKESYNKLRALNQTISRILKTHKA